MRNLGYAAFGVDPDYMRYDETTGVYVWTHDPETGKPYTREELDAPLEQGPVSARESDTGFAEFPEKETAVAPWLVLAGIAGAFFFFNR